MLPPQSSISAFQSAPNYATAVSVERGGVLKLSRVPPVGVKRGFVVDLAAANPSGRHAEAVNEPAGFPPAVAGSTGRSPYFTRYFDWIAAMFFCA